MISFVNPWFQIAEDGLSMPDRRTDEGLYRPRWTVEIHLFNAINALLSKFQKDPQGFEAKWNSKVRDKWKTAVTQQWALALPDILEVCTSMSAMKWWLPGPITGTMF